ELPGRTPEPVEHAIEVEVVHPGCTARERGPDREAIERPADVRRRCARVDPCLGEERRQARRRRRAGRDGDPAIAPRETRERSPRTGSGAGTTQAACTCEWRSRAASTSAGETVAPALLITSRNRPVKCRLPSASRWPRSPVWKNPSASKQSCGSRP